MINEPRYWKKDLARLAVQLQQCEAQRQWREGSYAKLEKLVMLAFYSTRKLIESEWVNSRLKDEPVSATAFPCRDTRMYRGSYQDVEEQYDLTKPSKRTPPLAFICNQIIHSFVFTPAFRRKRLAALYFCSYDKREHVFRVEISELVRILYKTSGSRHHVLLRFSAEINRFDES